MPDPRLMSALMLWTSFNTLRKGHVDLVLLNVLDLCLFFMPDPRLMMQQSQRSVCTSLLRALMLWTSSIH